MTRRYCVERWENSPEAGGSNPSPRAPVTMKLGITWKEPLGRPECPYMYRWALSLGPKGPSIRLHHWLRSDDKRFKHDHPADFITLVLKGRYTDLGTTGMNCPFCKGTGRHEDRICVRCVGAGQEEWIERMTPGKIRRRKAEHRHTVSVDPGGCWTLCFFFPDRRRWGFWVPRKLDGVVKWKKSNKFFYEHGHHPCDQP
jgi:hypothetical protein